MRMECWDLGPPTIYTRWKIGDRVLRLVDGDRPYVISENDEIVAVWPKKSGKLTTDRIEKEGTARRLLPGRRVHMFYDHSQNSWELGTVKTLGADLILNKDGDTIRNLFLGLATNFQLDQLNKAFTYTFLLAHPRDPKTREVAKPQIFLLSVQSHFAVKDAHYGCWEPHAYWSGKAGLPGLQEQEVSDMRLLIRSLDRGLVHHDCPGALIESGGSMYMNHNSSYRCVEGLRGVPSSDLYAFLAFQKMRVNRETVDAEGLLTTSWPTYRQVLKAYVGAIFQRYMETYVDGKSTYPPPRVGGRMGNHIWRLHTLFKAQPIRMSPTVVRKMLMREPTHSLYSGIVQHLTESRD